MTAGAARCWDVSATVMAIAWCDVRRVLAARADSRMNEQTKSRVKRRSVPTQKRLSRIPVYQR